MSKTQKSSSKMTDLDSKARSGRSNSLQRMLELEKQYMVRNCARSSYFAPAPLFLFFIVLYLFHFSADSFAHLGHSLVHVLNPDLHGLHGYSLSGFIHIHRHRRRRQTQIHNRPWSQPLPKTLLFARAFKSVVHRATRKRHSGKVMNLAVTPLCHHNFPL